MFTDWKSGSTCLFLIASFSIFAHFAKFYPLIRSHFQLTQQQWQEQDDQNRQRVNQKVAKSSSNNKTKEQPTIIGPTEDQLNPQSHGGGGHSNFVKCSTNNTYKSRNVNGRSNESDATSNKQEVSLQETITPSVGETAPARILRPKKLSKEQRQEMTLMKNRRFALRPGFPNGNLAHDFHENLQYLIDRTFQISNSSMNNSVSAWLVDEASGVNLKSWYGNLMIVVAKYLQIEILRNISAVRSRKLFLQDAPTYHDSPKKGSLRRRKKDQYLQPIVKTIRMAFKAQFEPYQNSSTQLIRLLYTRFDTCRRRLLNWASIACNFNAVTHSFAISVEQQYRLLSRTGLWVAPEGGHFTDIIFMPEQAVVIDIEAGMSNSWQLMFGTSKTIHLFMTVMATVREYNPDSSSTDHWFNDHIILDPTLTQSIAKKLIDNGVMNDFDIAC